MQDKTSGARAVEKMIQQYGCLPSVGEATSTLSEFNPKRLGEEMEKLIAMSKDYGMTKLTLHMDLPDAAKLAAHLRKDLD